MKNGIAVIGNAFVDIKGFPFGKYIPAGRNAGTVEIVHGGVGRNVAEDIANLELRPTFVSTVDDTAEGLDVVRKLKNHKVNTDYLIPTKDGMGMWLAIFNETGDVVGSISKRPDMVPLRQLIEEKGDEIFPDCDSIVIEIDMDRDLVKSVFRFAQKYGKKIYAVVSNMSIATERRDFFKEIDCFVCNLQEAELLFVEDFEGISREDLSILLTQKILSAGFSSLVVTLGADGAVYADTLGNHGVCPAQDVAVRDTTGAGDAFFAGVAAGLTYGCSLEQSVKIGTRLAGSVIAVCENVCPRFMPEELGIHLPEYRAKSDMDPLLDDISK